MATKGDVGPKRKPGRPKIKTPMPMSAQPAPHARDDPDALAAVAQKKRGRPTLWDPDFCKRVTGMCLLGLTNDELAVALEVSRETFEGWVTEKPEFRRAIREGREGADEKVARGLYLRAVGYEHPHDDIRTVSCAGANSGSEIVITPTTKRYPPDTQAAQLWLHVRQRKRFDFGQQGSGGFDPATTAAILRSMVTMVEEDAE